MVTLRPMIYSFSVVTTKQVFLFLIPLQERLQEIPGPVLGFLKEQKKPFLMKQMVMTGHFSKSPKFLNILGEMVETLILEGKGHA